MNLTLSSCHIIQNNIIELTIHYWYRCFNQVGDISTLDGTSLKLVDKFTYPGSSVSTEKDIDTRLTKAWTDIDKLSVIYQTWPIKWNAVSSKQRSCRYCCMDVPPRRLQNGSKSSKTATTQGYCEQYWTSPGGNTQQSTNYTATCLPSRKLSKLDEPGTQDTAGGAETSS